MKSIIQGFWDYIKDCFHDAFYKDQYAWKEGSIFHYIYQRKVGNKIRKERNIH